MMRMWRTLPAIAAAALATPAPAAPPPEPPRPLLWRCQAHITPIGTGMLDVVKTFHADGATVSQSVDFYDQRSPALLTDGAGQTGLSLTWDAGSDTGAPWPFDWGRGIAQPSYYPQNANVFARDKRARWRQTLIDRDGSFKVGVEGGRRYLVTPPGGLYLATELSPGTSPVSFPLATLFAWAGAQPALHVYFTAVEVKMGRDVYNPIRRRRIVVDYRLDMVALRATIAAIRVAVATWEAGLGDWRTRCPSAPEERPGDIVVT